MARLHGHISGYPVHAMSHGNNIYLFSCGVQGSADRLSICQYKKMSDSLGFEGKDEIFISALFCRLG